MVYEHAYLNTLLLLFLHSSFTLSVVKMLLKGEVGGQALNSHGNYIVDHGRSWKNHGIVFLNFCGNPGKSPNKLSPAIYKIFLQVHTPYLKHPQQINSENKTIGYLTSSYIVLRYTSCVRFRIFNVAF